MSRLSNLTAGRVTPASLLKGKMKNLIAALLLVAGVTTASAQSYINNPGQPTKTELTKLKGVQNYVQAEFTRDTTPVFVLNSLLYLSTNQTDGIIFVRTNATVLVHVGLPNPTNNVGRKYEVTTQGASTAVLTNWYTSSLFTSNNTMGHHTSYFINSNKTALAYSTGTNWLVRDY